MAESLVESLSADFEPAKYHDAYREQVLDLIERKAAGEEFEAPERRGRGAAGRRPDGALEASVKAAKDARGRHPAGGPDLEVVGSSEAKQPNRAESASRRDAGTPSACRRTRNLWQARLRDEPSRAAHLIA